MIDTSIVRVHQHAATRYDKLAANYLAFIQVASIRLWLRVYEFTALSSNMVSRAAGWRARSHCVQLDTPSGQDHDDRQPE
jgi:hypothetical protein